MLTYLAVAALVLLNVWVLCFGVIPQIRRLNILAGAADTVEWGPKHRLYKLFSLVNDQLLTLMKQGR